MADPVVEAEEDTGFRDASPLDSKIGGEGDAGSRHRQGGGRWIQRSVIVEEASKTTPTPRVPLGPWQRQMEWRLGERELGTARAMQWHNR